MDLNSEEPVGENQEPEELEEDEEEFQSLPVSPHELTTESEMDIEEQPPVVEVLQEPPPKAQGVRSSA